MRVLFFLTLFSIPLLATVGFIPPWGKDEALLLKKSLTPPLPLEKGAAAQLAEWVILFHQNVISPADGPRSHFRPTSSRYMLLAIRRYGCIKGYLMGCDRLLRENDDPWVYRTVLIDGKIFKWDPTFSSHKGEGSSKRKGSSKNPW